MSVWVGRRTGITTPVPWHCPSPRRGCKGCAAAESGGRPELNFYWRQTIVGLLRYAAEEIPEIAGRSLTAARELDRTLTSPRLEEAFELFQQAALLSRNPVYVTGAYYTMRALAEVGRFEEQAGGPVRATVTRGDSARGLPGGLDILLEDAGAGEEADSGILELFERIRCGATLEEALALFPLKGDETCPD